MQTLIRQKRSDFIISYFRPFRCRHSAARGACPLRPPPSRRHCSNHSCMAVVRKLSFSIWCVHATWRRNRRQGHNMALRYYWKNVAMMLYCVVLTLSVPMFDIIWTDWTTLSWSSCFVGLCILFVSDASLINIAVRFLCSPPPLR